MCFTCLLFTFVAMLYSCDSLLLLIYLYFVSIFDILFCVSLFCEFLSLLH